jgi:hypothetical protein
MQKRTLGPARRQGRPDAPSSCQMRSATSSTTVTPTQMRRRRISPLLPVSGSPREVFGVDLLPGCASGACGPADGSGPGRRAADVDVTFG